MAEPDVETLKQAFVYDPITGALTWKVNRGGGITPGMLAGTCKKGGISVKLFGKWYQAVRIAWILATNQPLAVKAVIGFKDGNFNNLQFSNLQYFQDMRARRLHCRQGRYLPGVSFIKDRVERPWKASISIDGKSHHLGIFSTEAQAHGAYKRAVALQRQSQSKGART